MMKEEVPPQSGVSQSPVEEDGGREDPLSTRTLKLDDPSSRNKVSLRG